MKKASKILAILMALVLSISLFASCGGSEPSDDNNSSAETTSAAGDNAADVDYSNVALTIKDGDFDAMSAFLDAWNDNTYDGKVIKITGISEQRTTNCTILEKDDKGTGRGCSWEIIDGKFPDDYPADGAKVTIAGVLTVTNEYGSRALRVPAENVEVVK